MCVHLYVHICLPIEAKRYTRSPVVIDIWNGFAQELC